MKQISKSPDRGKFGREAHIKSRTEKGLEPQQDYLDFLENSRRERDIWINKPENQVNNLEYDLRTTDWILEKARNSNKYAQNLYAAMCNNEFQKNDVWPILKEERWSCSWRSAGGIIANMRKEGDYIDWYCSGIKEIDSPEDEYVAESVVTDEIREDLLKLGWLVIEDDNDRI
jgi:hypothetical protein